MKFIVLLFISLYMFADESGVDCVILKDENSVICKYTHKRVSKEVKVKLEWIDPNGKVSRKRVMVIPPGHGSIYDYRYLEGRLKGKWVFRVIDKEKIYKTTFVIE